MSSESADERSEKWDSIGLSIFPWCGGYHECSSESFRSGIYIGMKIGNKSFLESPKVIGGVNVAVEDCYGVGFGIDNVSLPQRRDHEIGIVGIRGGAITLRGSRRGTRRKSALIKRGDHRGARVGSGNDQGPRGSPSNGGVGGRHVFDEEELSNSGQRSFERPRDF